MNLTELARRLHSSAEELRTVLPTLGFNIGARALKVDDRMIPKIERAFGEYRRKHYLAEKIELQKGMTGRPVGDAAPVLIKDITLPAVMTVRELASRLDVPVPRLMQELMRNGILASINDRIDIDTASIIGEDLGYKVHAEVNEGLAVDVKEDESMRLKTILDSQEKERVLPRPPIVVVMGHVDHGKTKLLDAIRATHVMETEAGGITQHIGAYQVVRNNQLLTFIDTPGHEAFTVMRSRGAKVADLAILVVAADDGVRPQTKEVINIIKSAKLPFVAAINKIDAPGADIEKVKRELSDAGFIPEEWGGQTIAVPISAKQGTNIDKLLDALLLVAEVEKEKIIADPTRLAIGTVIESHVDKNAGPVATVLVQSGTLRLGDALAARGQWFGRVRAMKNWSGEDVKEAPPSFPVKILGWKAAPAVGDIMEVPQDVKSLERVKTTEQSRVGTENVASIKAVAADGAEAKQFVNVIIRADVLGSLEAILGMLDTVKHQEVGIKVVGKGLGNVNDTDIANAEATHAVVLGFGVSATETAKTLARDKHVEIRPYTVIYRLFEDLITDLEKLLPSETVIEEVGRFEVLMNFKRTDNGWVIGGKVTQGKLVAGLKLRLSHLGEYVGEGTIEELRLGRSEIKTGQTGQEIGMQYVGKVKPEVGDLIEAYKEERRVRALVIQGISKR
ncbi:translation initiation factor IF-2 [Candidatus Uhrbacteria bacterium]|nr:translation initiation factor IF-2 [Candidatus Uhrbacteria bacterium]